MNEKLLKANILIEQKRKLLSEKTKAIKTKKEFKKKKAIKKETIKEKKNQVEISKVIEDKKNSDGIQEEKVNIESNNEITKNDNIPANEESENMNKILMEDLKVNKIDEPDNVIQEFAVNIQPDLPINFGNESKKDDELKKNDNQLEVFDDLPIMEISSNAVSIGPQIPISSTIKSLGVTTSLNPTNTLIVPIEKNKDPINSKNHNVSYPIEDEGEFVMEDESIIFNFEKGKKPKVVLL